MAISAEASANFEKQDLSQPLVFYLMVVHSIRLSLPRERGRGRIYVASDNRPRHLWSVVCGMLYVVCGLVFDA